MNLLTLLVVTLTIAKSGWSIERSCRSTSSQHDSNHLDSSIPPEVLTSNGNLKGKTILTATGKEVDAFLGIPFAQPPVGNLRFKRPVPYDTKFESDFDATKLPNACPQQKIEMFGNFEGEAAWNPNTPVSEDCLYLNVWVPASSSNEEKSNVLFWIYGGAFYSGSSSLDVYNGAHLAAESNLIVVSTQYRVGPLGFLYLGTEDAPGNQGLLDQNLALQWVHKNIEAFGGNPEEVTLFGESAGAASVTYHMLSRMSEKLFKNAVVMSGAATASWALRTPEKAKRFANKLAQLADCPESDDASNVVDCLRRVDHSILTREQFNVFPNPIQFPMPPTLDNYFLKDTPQNLLKSGKLEKKDILIGNTLDEGSYFLPYIHPQVFSPFETPRVPNRVALSVLHDYFHTLGEEQDDAIYDLYRQSEPTVSNEELINRAVGDAFFTCPCHSFADVWSSHGNNVYYYVFAQHTASDPWGQWMGVKHGDEVAYYFGQALNITKPYTLEETLLSQRMVGLLTNFAKTGIPSEEWSNCKWENETAGKVCSVYLSSGVGNSHVQRRYEHCNFWKQQIPKL